MVTAYFANSGVIIEAPDFRTVIAAVKHDLVWDAARGNFDFVNVCVNSEKCYEVVAQPASGTVVLIRCSDRERAILRTF